MTSSQRPLSFLPLMKAPLCREEEMETRISGPQPKDTSILGIGLLVSRNISIWLISTVRNYVLAVSTGEGIFEILR